MRKSRSRGFVVSLSGGADSAAIASMCACLVGLAARDLGLDGLKRVLDYVPGLSAAQDVPQVVDALLTTVYQSTRNSSAVTRAAARGVAEGLGARHLELDVDAQVQGYVSMIEGALGRQLDWQTDDIALQNIQARTRAPSVWLLANISGALLLSTSNRSEAAVGYATMDGDTAGGLAPIAGIDKAYLRRWLVWLEREGPAGLAAIPALAAVNVQAPTAELRPAAENQTDEGDLMPYDLLDAIERAAIRDKRGPLEVFELMAALFPQHGKVALVTWIERFFRLFARNQWKRERYAPSFHLDDENLDPKTWCRFPILSGGYERELKQLRSKILG
jgi:NAD+ synthase (glutamine-hydrolysing)